MRGHRLNDRYALRQLTGSGGMGEVRRAYGSPSQREVAALLSCLVTGSGGAGP
ncbi:hypothetical protein [Streptomyces iconiensis]|uniref:Uncharacterized protein n=1 Tax=Streptomyces iconiensis TaxID=1384038 RepID=A0ABT7A0G5_9ACTN|nr:hypothetical protein [Streptomyces iconiensis]MDJ1134820.1 hypothetical protein [Streptomyces iconiensis]